MVVCYPPSPLIGKYSQTLLQPIFRGICSLPQLMFCQRLSLALMLIKLEICLSPGGNRGPNHGLWCLFHLLFASFLQQVMHAARIILVCEHGSLSKAWRPLCPSCAGDVCEALPTLDRTCSHIHTTTIDAWCESSASAASNSLTHCECCGSRPC